MNVSTAASVANRARMGVAMFEPHRAGHAHMRYSASLVAALAQVCADRRFSLLVSPEGAVEPAAVPGVEIDPVIPVPRSLASYRSRLLGILDRCARWGRTDRQIAHWARAHPQIRLIHYQDAFGLATLAGLAVLRRLGVRSLLTVHNVRPHDRPSWQPALLKDFIDRILFRRFDGLVVHSEGLKLALEDFLGPQSPPVYVVPHGVGETLRSGRLAPLAERMAGKQLLFVGSPRPNKGLPLLLEALPLLPGFSLTIGGFHGGDQLIFAQIENLIASAREKGCLIRLCSGFLPDAELDQLLRTHSVVMLPYRKDFQAQSGVLSQAIAYRVPVVATDVGAVGDTARRFGLGCVVPPGSAAGLALGVERLYESVPAQLEVRLEAAARALAWDSVASTLSQVYDRICSQHGLAA
jgi:glycosyltransferase involved in cell wall biosynthesis